MLRFESLEHQVNECQRLQIVEFKHQRFESFQKLSAGSEKFHIISLTQGHVAGENVLQGRDVLADPRVFRFTVGPSTLLDVEGQQRHELEHVVEIVNRDELEPLNESADTRQTILGTHVIHNVIPARIVVELSTTQGVVTDLEVGPHPFEIKGPVPVPAGHTGVVPISYAEMCENLFQQQIGQVAPSRWCSIFINDASVVVIIAININVTSWKSKWSGKLTSKSFHAKWLRKEVNYDHSEGSKRCSHKFCLNLGNYFIQANLEKLF